MVTPVNLKCAKNEISIRNRLDFCRSLESGFPPREEPFFGGWGGGGGGWGGRVSAGSFSQTAAGNRAYIRNLTDTGWHQETKVILTQNCTQILHPKTKL